MSGDDQSAANSCWTPAFFKTLSLKLNGASDEHAVSCAGGDYSPRAAGLAIASDLLGTDECIDAFLDEALQGGETEVSPWGGSPSAEEVDFTQYRLSDAARIFRAHALAAAGLMDAQVDPFELLLRSDQSSILAGQDLRA